MQVLPSPMPLFLHLFPLPEDWYEQLYPLILTLKDCMEEVVNRAKQSLTFVLLQELAYSLPQCLMLTLRRDIVFSQAVGASCVVGTVQCWVLGALLGRHGGLPWAVSFLKGSFPTVLAPSFSYS